MLVRFPMNRSTRASTQLPGGSLGEYPRRAALGDIPPGRPRRIPPETSSGGHLHVPCDRAGPRDADRHGRRLSLLSAPAAAGDFGDLPCGARGALCVLAYVLGGLHRNSAGGAGIIIVAVSAVVLPTLVLAANLGTMILPLLWGGGHGRGLLLLTYAMGWLFFLPTLWFVATFVRSLGLACGAGVPRAFLLSAVPLLVVALPNNAEDLLLLSTSRKSLPTSREPKSCRHFASTSNGRSMRSLS